MSAQSNDNGPKNDPVAPRDNAVTSAERRRLDEARDGSVGWRHWGPYLSDRQWGTVRSGDQTGMGPRDRKSTRLNSSH